MPFERRNTIASGLSFAQRRPLACRMDQGQHPYDVAFDLVHQTIAFVRDQLASAGDFPGPAKHWKIRQLSGCDAEKLVQPGGRPQVVGRDMIPHLGAILLRLWRPNDLHARLATLLRRAANSVSTSSLDRPRPARTDARATSTLRRRNPS